MQEVIDEMSNRFSPDVKEINRAFTFSINAHGNQRRRDNTPYIAHPIEVARILAKAGFEEDMIIAALFHDIVEDCDVGLDEIERRFGKPIAEIVDAVSQVDKELANESDYTKRDLDFLSDYKFLMMSSTNQKAFYVKLADRIHNLRTISCFPIDKIEAKVKHTKSVLIPAAKKMNIFLLVDQLEALCLEIEKPSSYGLIHNGYTKLLEQNEITLNQFKDYFRECLANEGLYRKDAVVSLDFRERTEGSIFRHITKELPNYNDLPTKINKENIYLYDINFIVNDKAKDPLSYFMKIYPDLHESKFRFTITGMDHSFTSKTPFYQAKDRYDNRYRLFIQKEHERLHNLHGVKTINGEDEIIPAHIMYINETEPDEPEHKMIKVFLRNGDPIYIEEGATVLDLAFKLHSEIGLCATGAIMKTNNARLGLHTRLQDGDTISIEHDHHKHNSKEDIHHATIRWFEYLHTRNAIKTLSRWFEKHPSPNNYPVTVSCKKQLYSLPIGSTVLDLAFLHSKNQGLHLSKVYLNNGSSPVSFDKVLKQDDKVSIFYDMDVKPSFEWIKMVSTDYAKDCLIEYFNNRYNN